MNTKTEELIQFLITHNIGYTHHANRKDNLIIIIDCFNSEHLKILGGFGVYYDGDDLRYVEDSK
jgi:hypothetical protein